MALEAAMAAPPLRTSLDTDGVAAMRQSARSPHACGAHRDRQIADNSRPMHADVTIKSRPLLLSALSRQAI
jgi:hypothetical protein